MFSKTHFPRITGAVRVGREVTVNIEPFPNIPLRGEEEISTFRKCSPSMCSLDGPGGQDGDWTGGWTGGGGPQKNPGI